MLQYVMLEHLVRNRHEERAREADTERLLRVESSLAPISRLANRQFQDDDTTDDESDRAREVPA